MLDVVFASDNNYVPLLSISLVSLLENNQNDFNQINIYILDDGISEVNKEKIYEISKNYNCKIVFIKTTKLQSMNLNLLGIEKELTGSSLTTYARLFISSLLPEDIEKVLYLDCDSLIVDSFKELWNINFDEYYCCGVLDTLNEKLLEYFGYKKEDNYINAGFLLINLKKWREDKVEQKFISFLSNNQDQFFFHDQGVINETFKHKIKIIEPKYNLQFYFQTYDYSIAKKFEGFEGDYYNREIVEESRKNPIFLHFCGSEYDRPWNNKDHIYANEFKKYAEMVNCEEVINYIDAPNLKVKLFYKWSKNPIINLFLKLIPLKFIKNMVDKNAIEYFDNEKIKARKNYEKHAIS